MRKYICDHCGEEFTGIYDYRFVGAGIILDVEVFGRLEDLCDKCNERIAPIISEARRKWDKDKEMK